MEFLNAASGLILIAFAGVGALLFSRRLDRIESRFETIPTRKEWDIRFDAVDQRLDRLEERMDRIEERLGRAEAQLGGMRGDITQIAIALGARLRPQTG
jgi:hypothetical protein